MIRLLSLLRVLVPYEIGQNDFDVIFLPNNPEKYHVLGTKSFVTKIFFKLFVKIKKFASSIGAFFPKNSALIN